MYEQGNVTLAPWNVTELPVPGNSPWDDATWILTSAFIIFTMQSGFGLLESGTASRKNEVNIMLKNVVDVVFGGVTYWAVGYGLTFGDGPGSNAFTGVGHFFLDPQGEDLGNVYSKFVFQASFATTATTIVSGAMAERTKLTAYIVFSLLNTFVYSFPAHWVWSDKGWLKRLNVVDVAGVGPVHLVGGITSLVAAIMLKPRSGRFKKNSKIYQHIPSSNPVNALLGLFMLWWGWLGFNCGSTFGISGGKWKLATRSAATTILGSCGGGMTAFILSFILHDKKYIIPLIVNGILGALVSVSAICAVTTTWAALIIGSVGAMIAATGDRVLFRLKIDDPIGASSVHMLCSIWGLMCCGIFAQKDIIENEFNNYNGLIWGGGWYLLGVQTLAVMVISLWSAVMSTILLKLIDLTVGLRVSPEEEMVGADFHEHNIIPPDGVTPVFSKRAEVTRSLLGKGDDSGLDKKKVVFREMSCFCFGRKRTVLQGVQGSNSNSIEEELDIDATESENEREGRVIDDNWYCRSFVNRGFVEEHSDNGEHTELEVEINRKTEEKVISHVDDIHGD